MYWPSFKMTLTQCLIWLMLKSQIFCRKGVKYQDLRILQLSIHSAWTMIKLHILNQAHIPWMLLAPFEASNLPMTFYIFTMLHTSWLNKHPFQKMIQLTTLGSQNRFNFFGANFFSFNWTKKWFRDNFDKHKLEIRLMNQWPVKVTADM